ncbi:hypothetical protein M9Y10_027640 [Tritrichomonas musculus]|uniref:Uncharacterized protein n=1 Tax=Tritrichomonas musculus TaxID=1915356 RepID=A0ABR2H5V0_9EUKA
MNQKNGYNEENHMIEYEDELGLKKPKYKNDVKVLQKETMNIQKQNDTLSLNIKEFNSKNNEIQENLIKNNRLDEIISVMQLMKQIFTSYQEQINEIKSTITGFHKRLSSLENILMLFKCYGDSGSMYENKNFQKSIDFLTEEIKEIKLNFSNFVTSSELHSAFISGFRESNCSIGNQSNAWMAANNSF